MQIYKLCPVALYQQAQESGVLLGSEHDLRDGFIHFSTASQLLGTYQKYFSEIDPVVLMCVEAAPLGAALRFEASRDGALFPHLYASLPMSAVTRVDTLTRATAAEFFGKIE
jgi:uncharacterized protein (DUF952 family)